MKKFWNLMLAVLVMLGAAACAENRDSVDVKDGEGLSFYANFVGDQTRTDLEYDENAELWKTVWEGNETIWVRGADFIAYEFTNTVEEPNKFTCKTEGAENLVGGAVVITMSDRDQSKVGKRGVSVYHTISSFDPKSHIEFEADNAFLRYKYEGEGSVTLTITSDADPNQKLFYYDGENQSSVTFEGADQDKWISVCPSGDGNVVNLSYSIDGVECAETRFEIVKGMIYNLGTLAVPTEPEYDSHIYLVPSEEWIADNAWFVAYFFDSVGGYADVKLTDVDADGIYECGVPAGMEKVIFCRMNPDFAEFGWNTGEESETDPKHVWNQTADLEIGVEPNNYYHIVGWDNGAWGTKDYYELPVVPVSDYKLYVYNRNTSWGTVNLYMWNDAGPMVAWPGVAYSNTTTINGYEYLVWDITKDMEGASVSIILNDGTQQTGDFVLGVFNKDYYVALEGSAISLIADPSNPAGGAGGSDSEVSTWALAGEFNSWGNTEMLTTSVNGLYVAKDITIADYGKFKVKDVNTWDISYGGGFKYLNSNIWTKTYSNGSDFAVVKGGTYDIYFDKTNERIYVMAAGTSYSSATEQTEEGPAPDLSGASWGLVGSHNSWGTPDVKMEWNGSMYVAQSVTLTGEFKVRANEAWTENYGSGSTITVNNTSGTTVYENGGNCKVASGTYDVYFDLQGKQIWVKTPGSTAPSK